MKKLICWERQIVSRCLNSINNGGLIMRLIDEGIQLEMNLKSMSREELERAYIEAKENEAV